jgi:glycosyltransferase involved in cell wall biosynthesis
MTSFEATVQSRLNPKIIHAAALLRPSSGMLNQMKIEQHAADRLGIYWNACMFTLASNRTEVFDRDYSALLLTISAPRGLPQPIRWIYSRWSFYRWLLKQQSRYDAYVLRYYVHDPFQLYFLYRCKKPTFLVHHTLEEQELRASNSPISSFRFHLEKVIGPYAIRAARGVIGVTREITSHEIQRSGQKDTKWSYIYPNGTIVQESTLIDRRSSKTPELLFLANFSPWHGLDLLLDRLEGNSDDFVLHVAGKCNGQQLSELSKDSRVVYHGEIVETQIAALSEQCWIGIAPLALHRKSMKSACPLKTREYLKNGLPVYGGSLDIFPEEFPFYMTGPAEIREILRYSFAARKHRKEDVRELSAKYIDKITLLGDLYKSICSEIAISQ